MLTRRALGRLVTLLAALPVQAEWRSAMVTDPTHGCGVPVARDDGWPVAANNDTLIDRVALCKMAERLAASSDANVHAVVVARHGKLVFEHYFRGSDDEGALMLLSAAVRKSTGQALDEFARATLLEPLGITSVEWFRVNGGDSDAGSGLRLRPRDMAKIGQLVLAGGRWNDRKIVSKAWIETSTRTSTAPDSIFTDTSGGSAAPCSRGVMSTEPPLLAAAGRRSKSFPSSISLPYSPPDSIRTTARERSRFSPVSSGMF
jgi:hypothetical protein